MGRLAVKAAMGTMRQQGDGGRIVVTASTASALGAPNKAAYAISKHAVIGLVRSAALAGAPHGIRVNAVAPGPTETRMMRSIEEQVAPGAAEAAKARIASGIPLGRYGRPEEVARLVLFLVSDESSYCTGGVFPIDGAVTII